MNRIYLFLPIGIIAISTASIFIKLCDAPALIIATYRMMLASLMLTPFACYKKPWSGLISYGDMALSKEALIGDGFALLGAMAGSGYLLVGRKMRKDQDLFSYI